MSGAIPPSGATPAMESFCLQVPNSSEWLGLVTGALLKLTYNYYWDQSYEGWEEARDAGKAILASWFERNPCLAEISGTENCTDFPLSSGFINFYPDSPYLNPDTTPAGWSGPPFSFVGSGDILLGYQAGDILVTGFPEPDSGDPTLPSITFHLTGDGTIELHMLTVLNGGMAIVTVDGDLLNSKTFDLNADAVSLPEESNALELVYESKLETTGDHTVEVRFAPVLDDTLIPIRYGGGIRAVVLCGFDEMSIDIRTDPENDCIIQKTYDGTSWDNVIDVSACAAVEVATSATNTASKGWAIVGGVTKYTTDNVTYNTYNDTQYSDFGGPTATQINDPVGVDKQCLRAKNNVAYLMATMSELSKGLSVGGSVASLIGIIIGLLGAIPSGGTSLGATAAITALSGAVANAGSNFLSSLFTAAVLKQLQCDLNDAFETDGSMTTAGYATLIALFDSRGLGVWSIISYWFKTLGPLGMVWAGTQALGSVTNCDVDPCDDTLIREFNFLESPDGWDGCMRDFQEVTGTITQGSKFLYPGALWVSRKGWTTQYMRYYNSNGQWWGTYIHIRPPHALNLNRVTFEADYLMSPAMTALANKIGTLLSYNTSGTQILSQTFGPQFNSNPSGIVTGDVAFSSVAVPANGEVKVQIDVLKIGQSYGPPYGGYCNIRKIRFYGSE